MNHSGTKILMFINASLFLIFITGCADDKKIPRSSSNIRPLDDTIVNYNKQILKTEYQEIEDFIERHKWKLKKSQTGLRYIIYSLGKGPKATPGKLVKINYSVSLLTGQELYNSKNLGSKEFVVGRGNIESGVEEGILLLRAGDKAKFIVPSHLAWGLLGDLDKVPERAALVYEIEILEISAKP
jgi:FKBP-type peptidyl-prolyl cis-trans isomerase FkpA